MRKLGLLEGLGTGRKNGYSIVNFNENDYDKQEEGSSLIGSWDVDRSNFVSFNSIEAGETRDFVGKNVFYQLRCVRDMHDTVWVGNFGRSAKISEILDKFDDIINEYDIYSEFDEVESRLASIKGFKSFKLFIK